MKTIKIKKAIALFLLFHPLFFIALKSQNLTTRKSICDEMLKCNYIFEGKIISSKRGIRFKADKHKYYNFDSYLVQVKKVIKGDIQKGTIKIITGTYEIGFEDTGRIQHYILSDGSPYDFIPPNEAIYFCSTELSIKDFDSTDTNSKLLEYYYGASMSNGELKKDTHDNLIGYFPTLSDFYSYISANYGVKIEDK